MSKAKNKEIVGKLYVVDEIQEMTREGLAAWRKEHGLAQPRQYRDDDHRAAVAAWLAHEWHIKPPEYRHNHNCDQWVEVGLHEGISDEELLANADTRLAAMRQIPTLAPHHIDAYAKFVQAHGPKPRRKVQPGLKGRIAEAVVEAYQKGGRVTKKRIAIELDIPLNKLSRDEELAAVYDRAIETLPTYTPLSPDGDTADEAHKRKRRK